MLRVYESLSGVRIEFPEPKPNVARFLARLQEMLDDSSVSENDMIALAYSKENPILDPTIFPERGAVTKSVLGDPVYAVICDILFRKRVVQDGIDLKKLAATYSVPLPDAAKEIGVTEMALRNAIYARKLPCWVKDGRYYLTQRAIDSYEATKQGPKRPEKSAPEPLKLCMGHAEGTSFRVRYPGDLVGEARVEGNIITGRVPTWKRVAILSGGKGQHRLFYLEPADEPNVIELGPFYARGHFSVTKENSSQRARAEFDTFEAE